MTVLPAWYGTERPSRIRIPDSRVTRHAHLPLGPRDVPLAQWPGCMIVWISVTRISVVTLADEGSGCLWPAGGESLEVMRAQLEASADEGMSVSEVLKCLTS